MDQLIGFTLRISKVSKNTDTSWAGSGAGRNLPSAFFKFGVVTEITLIDGSGLFLEIPGIVRTGCHTGLAANAFVRIHLDNTICFILIGGLGWTDPYTGRVVAVIAQDRHESTFPLALSNRDAAFQYVRSIAMGRDIIGVSACLQATLAINAMALTNYHGVVWAIRKFSHWHLAAI